MWHCVIRVLSGHCQETTSCPLRLATQSLFLLVPSLIFVVCLGYGWGSGWVSLEWLTMILCLGPAGSSRSSTKHVHECDEVGRSFTTHVAEMEPP